LSLRPVQLPIMLSLAYTCQKYWGKTKILGENVETDKCMGVSQLLGVRALAPPRSIL